MSCKEKFECNKKINLLLLNKHCEQHYNRTIVDILPIIERHIIFDPINDHHGEIIPLYYHCGLPCRIWKCARCELILPCSHPINEIP